MAQQLITQFEKDFPASSYKVLVDSQDDEILRQISSPISPDLITTDQFKAFTKILYDSMMKCELEDGWVHTGISAIQVGVPIRMFYAYDLDKEKFEIYVNPEIEIINTTTDIKDEGCLSLPGCVNKVRRYKKIRIKYYDKNGNKTSKRMSGWNARVVQHENDHLNGILFTDKLEV